MGRWATVVIIIFALLPVAGFGQSRNSRRPALIVASRFGTVLPTLETCLEYTEQTGYWKLGHWPKGPMEKWKFEKGGKLIVWTTKKLAETNKFGRESVEFQEAETQGTWRISQTAGVQFLELTFNEGGTDLAKLKFDDLNSRVNQLIFDSQSEQGPFAKERFGHSRSVDFIHAN